MTTIDTGAVIAAAETYARQELGGDGGGHDWWHVHRVRNLAVELAGEMGADRFVTELAALLHDIADYKISGSLTAGTEAAAAFCRDQGLPENVVTSVASIVERVSFKGAKVAEADLSLEGLCVRDADRLDALGALGIGRAFAYGGQVCRPMWDPDQPSQEHTSEAAYRSGTGSTINHFHEKLLLLRERMGTSAGRRRADHRHDFLTLFLNEFMAEWNGTDGPKPTL